MSSDGRLRLIAYVLRVLVGTVFAFQFFDNLDHDNYTATGYRRLIESFVERGNAPAPWQDVMQFTADHASVFAPLQAITEAALAVGLLAGVAVPLLALVAGGLLTGLFVSELGIYWLWELPPLIVACALIVLACAPGTRTGLRRLVTDRVPAGFPFGRSSLPGRLAASALAGVVVGALALAHRADDTVALGTGLTVGVLLVVDVLLDRRLRPLASARP